MSSTSLSHLNILIAEDQEINQFILKKIFSKWNLSPTFVSNGEDAVEACMNGHFDIIFLDIQMPIMGGYEAAKLMRANKIATPIVAISASAYLEASAAVIDSGMDGFIGKPYTPSELLECINKFANK